MFGISLLFKRYPNFHLLPFAQLLFVMCFVFWQSFTNSIKSSPRFNIIRLLNMTDCMFHIIHRYSTCSPILRTYVAHILQLGLSSHSWAPEWPFTLTVPVYDLTMDLCFRQQKKYVMVTLITAIRVHFHGVRLVRRLITIIEYRIATAILELTFESFMSHFIFCVLFWGGEGEGGGLKTKRDDNTG